MFLAVCGVLSATVYFPVMSWSQTHKITVEPMVEGCLPWRSYILDTENITVNRWDLVAFPSKGMQPVADDGLPVGKLVAGVAGDEVLITGGRLYINGEYMGDTSYGAERFSKPATEWDTRYIIPQGRIFVIGSEKRSWDSRYWGLVDTASVSGNLRPIF